MKTPKPQTQTPDKQIEQAYRQLKQSLASDLRDQRAKMNPFRFEQLVVDLLFAMGYGGSRKEAASITKKTTISLESGTRNWQQFQVGKLYNIPTLLRKMNQTSFIKSLKFGGIIMLTLICNVLSLANEHSESVTTVDLSDRWPSWKAQYLEKGMAISLTQAGPIGFHDVHIRFLSGKHTMEVEICTALFQVSDPALSDEDEWSTSSGWLALPAGYSQAQISEKQWKQMMALMKQSGIKPALSTTTRVTKAAVTIGRWHSCIFDLKASDSDVLLQLLLVFYADIPRTEKIDLWESANAGASKP